MKFWNHCTRRETDQVKNYLLDHNWHFSRSHSFLRIFCYYMGVKFTCTGYLKYFINVVNVCNSCLFAFIYCWNVCNVIFWVVIYTYTAPCIVHIIIIKLKHNPVCFPCFLTALLTLLNKLGSPCFWPSCNWLIVCFLLFFMCMCLVSSLHHADTILKTATWLA